MTLDGVLEMTLRRVVDKDNPEAESDLKKDIEHAIREAQNQSARSGDGIRTKVRFMVGSHTVTVGPDDDPDVKYEEFKILEPRRS